MKNLLLGFILFLFVSCGRDQPNVGISFGDFIKPNYSTLVSFKYCTLKPSHSLNSLESFIASLIERLSKENADNIEVFFYFPVRPSQTDISEFNLVLHHSNQQFLDKTNDALKALQFSNIADCQLEQESKNFSKLKSDTFATTETLVETMTCDYLQNYNFATLNLVFEQLISALADVSIGLELHYLETASPKQTFQWRTVFPSAEDRASFLEDWRLLQVSSEMQDLLAEQATCGESELFKSYKII